MTQYQPSLFHRIFDKFYPLIRFYHERVRGNAWFSQIAPSDGIPETLWLGGAPDTPGDYDFLLRNGIRAVLDVRAERSDELEFFRGNDITYLKVSTPDIIVPAPQDITAAVGWIGEQVAAGRPVLVHCAKGRGRSATILAAYLMQQHGMDYDEVRELLTFRRRLTRLESRHKIALEKWLGM